MDATIETKDCAMPGYIDPTRLLLNESEALGRTGSEADDTLSEMSVDAETLRLTKNVALHRRLLENTSLWLTVNAALKSGTIDEDKDAYVENDWLSKNAEDNISRLAEYKLLGNILSEEWTLKVTDWEWL